MGNWDTFIENLVIQSNNSLGIPQIHAACIFSRKCGFLYNSENWPNLCLSGGERILIARSLLNRDFSLFQSRGIWCMDDLFYLERAGREFVFRRKEGEESLTIRETETGGLQGRGGCEGGNNRKYALSDQTEMVLNSVVVAAYSEFGNQSIINATIDTVVTYLNKWEKKHNKTNGDGDISRTQSSLANDSISTLNLSQNSISEYGGGNNSYSSVNDTDLSECDTTATSVSTATSVLDRTLSLETTTSSEFSDATLTDDVFNRTISMTPFGFLDDYDTDTDCEFEAVYAVNKEHDSNS